MELFTFLGLEKIYSCTGSSSFPPSFGPGEVPAQPPRLLAKEAVMPYNKMKIQKKRGKAMTLRPFPHFCRGMQRGRGHQSGQKPVSGPACGESGGAGAWRNTMVCVCLTGSAAASILPRPAKSSSPLHRTDPGPVRRTGDRRPAVGRPVPLTYRQQYDHRYKTPARFGAGPSARPLSLGESDGWKFKIPGSLKKNCWKMPWISP